jgi:hypothetical protein
MKLEIDPTITPKRSEIGYIIPASTKKYRTNNCIPAPITVNNI